MHSSAGTPTLPPHTHVPGDYEGYASPRPPKDLLGVRVADCLGVDVVDAKDAVAYLKDALGGAADRNLQADKPIQALKHSLSCLKSTLQAISCPSVLSSHLFLSRPLLRNREELLQGSCRRRKFSLGEKTLGCSVSPPPPFF